MIQRKFQKEWEKSNTVITHVISDMEPAHKLQCGIPIN